MSVTVFAGNLALLTHVFSIMELFVYLYDIFLCMSSSLASESCVWF